MPNPVVLESDGGGGELSIWTISIKKCQEASSNDQREPEDCPISLEELH
jgi:hypothetical protein